MSVNSKMTALADEIRELSGITTNKSIDTMTSDVDAANTEISSQAELISQIQTALVGKAGNSGSGGGGTILPTLTNPASTSDILSGKEAINSSGVKITGTIATKTASSLTASGATVTVPAGYYASNATKSVATTTQATPSVSVNSSGLITASATQTAGYVSAGTKSGTKQLTTQAAKTITPSTSSQTAVASGVYTTGIITVAAIPSTYEQVTTETDAYTTKLASLETAVTALETELAGKASGGSGGNINTCSVVLQSGDNQIDYYETYIVTTFENGKISNVYRVASSSEETSDSFNITLNNVVCGSLIYINVNGWMTNDWTITNGGEFVNHGFRGTILKAPSTAGVTAVYTLYGGD